MRGKAVPLLVVVIVTLAAFGPVLGNRFVNWDDDKNFLTNPHYRGLAPANLRWMFTTFHLGHYQPMAWLTLGLDYELFGMDPSGYHLTNLLLHAANAGLFFLLALRLLGGRRWTAAVAALLFSVHPLRVESVAWVSERRDLLSGFFFLLAILAYLRAHQDGPRRRWLGWSLAAFTAALLSKSIVVTLPVVLLAIDWYPLRRLGQIRKALLEKIPYFALSAAAAVLTFAAQPAGLSGAGDHLTVQPELRIGLSLYGLAFYLWKTLVPLGLYPQYALDPKISASDWRILLGGIVVLAVTAAAVAFRRRYPAIPAVWVCYAVSLLPVLSLFRLDPQQYVADHHTYLATLGVALLGAAAWERLPGNIAPAVATVAVLALSALTHRQTRVWRDPVSLWTHAIAGSPGSAVANNNLGEALFAAGRIDEAIPRLTLAIKVRPSYTQAHYNLGQALFRQGKFEAAAGHFLEAARLDSTLAAAHNDLANCYAHLGQADQALAHYRRALDLQPAFADAHYNLGNLLQGQGRFEQAIEHYREALRHNPSLSDAHNNWGVALDRLGRPSEAIEHYRGALLLDPRNADAHNNLGISLESAGKPGEAVEHYREALRWNPAHADARANLARHLSR